MAEVDNAIALTCARLCQEVYKDFSGIKFEALPDTDTTLIQSEDSGFTDTQVAFLHKEGSEQIFVVFRGSDRSVDWMNNFQIRQQVYPYGDGNSDVKFHCGFMTAYFAVRDRLLPAIEKIPQPKIVITGHSLGGALATIAALDIQYNITSKNNQAIEVYTFGAPRVGNQALAESYNQRVPDSFRYVFGWDIVTRTPRSWQGYTHVEKEVVLGSRWTWRVLSRRFSDHAIDNYISALAEETKGQEAGLK
ncbi:lipase family protein [Pseudanabaena sp. FACHB-2040]|uniref:lipase family protein n=1 Tax=Pseudanabaena sp. FACHB-2040 TaxID=2692859 RepID=UPI001685EABC|nr:lipase family protein [Pseudanabaena sp. FACHB-2040]MBD2258557.1 lipase family protein [Pseudanabaena sp. FACHB-2040]